MTFAKSPAEREREEQEFPDNILDNKVIKFQNKTWEFGLHKHEMTQRAHLYILNKTSGRLDDNAYVSQSMKVVSDFQLPEYIARKILQRIGYRK